MPASPHVRGFWRYLRGAETLGIRWMGRIWRKVSVGRIRRSGCGVEWCSSQSWFSVYCEVLR